MTKKLFYILMILFCSSYLYAFSAGDIVLYPNIGIGTTTGGIKGMSEEGFGLWIAEDEDFFVPHPDRTPEGVTKAFVYTIGFIADYMITDSLSVTSGLSYDRVPYQLRYPVEDEKIFILSYDFSFITVPLGIHYHTRNSFLIGGGVYYGIMVSDELEVSNIPSAFETDDIKKIKNEVDETNNDIGVYLDFGYNLKIGERGTVLFLTRYKHGFTEVYGDPRPLTKLQMRTLTVNVGYGFVF